MPSMGISEQSSINLYADEINGIKSLLNASAKKQKRRLPCFRKESFSIPKRSHTDILYSRERVIATVFKPAFDFIPYISFTHVKVTQSIKIIRNQYALFHCAL